MKSIKCLFHSIYKISALLLVAAVASCGSSASTDTKSGKARDDLNMYVIERKISGIGNFTPEELKKISQASNNVLNSIGPGIQWVHSYVTGDKIYCVYRARDTNAILQHAKASGFPANFISKVATIIDPGTAKEWPTK